MERIEDAIQGGKLKQEEGKGTKERRVCVR